MKAVSAPATRGLAIDELLRQPVVEPGAVAAFLEARTFPIVEGPFCTFVFQGEADAVLLRHWIFGLPSSQAFERLSGTDLWTLVLELPEGSRVEYKIELHRGPNVELIRDPLNPLLARDPFGANSVCHASGYATPEWTQPDPDVRRGRVEDRKILSRTLGGTRPVSLYFPARYRPTRRYPLLVVHDGADYARYASLTTVLDNLVHRFEVPGMIVALTQSPDRLDEYAASDKHARFLVDELVPTLERELPLIGTPESRGLVGASLGAVGAFHAAARNQGFFGRLLLQSGSFAFSDIGDHDRGPIFDRVVKFMNGYRAEPTSVTDRLFLSCGIYESIIYENRSLVPVLQGTGTTVRYVEARDGHNWENWRDRLREGLSWLFPGPLWMVYE